MADGTWIEWTDATWNPIRGCSKVDRDCLNCYAERVAARFSDQGQPYHGTVTGAGKWSGEITLVKEHLDDPWEFSYHCCVCYRPIPDDEVDEGYNDAERSGIMICAACMKERDGSRKSVHALGGRRASRDDAGLRLGQGVAGEVQGAVWPLDD